MQIIPIIIFKWLHKEIEIMEMILFGVYISILEYITKIVVNEALI